MRARYKLAGEGALNLGLVADNLTCTKRDRVLFESLSFTLLAGQLLYLRGPNGAGKTSLLRLVTGLGDPDQGTITFNGLPVSGEPAYQSQLIYLGHKSGLNSMLSATDNLRFWLAQQGQTFNIEHVYDILDTLGLAGLEDIPVRMLSAGQQRRAALARLWLKKASIWVLDEPFTALDNAGIALLEEAFATQVDNGGMILTTSHQALTERCGKVDTLDLEFRF